jgi:hypothetical protein
MTLFELLNFLLVVGFVISGVLVGQNLFGWPGAVGGFALGVAAGLLRLDGIYRIGGYLEDMLYRGRPRRPVCKNGTCHLYDYKAAWEEIVAGPRRYMFRLTCHCGTSYQRLGRRFMVVLPDGSLEPYMVWRPFRGWFPDEGEAIKPS